VTRLAVLLALALACTAAGCTRLVDLTHRDGGTNADGDNGDGGHGLSGDAGSPSAGDATPSDGSPNG
jgi:hypothetical protein